MPKHRAAEKTKADASSSRQKSKKKLKPVNQSRNPEGAGVSLPGNDDEDDDDVIIIDEKGHRLEDGDGKKGVDGDCGGSTQLCVFHRQVITEHDYKTLADSEYLNDAVINFYLTYLFEQLPRRTKDLVHIYSSHFYSRLKGGSKSNKDKSKKLQTQAERCYNRVKSWTKKVDIFSKRMLIFPICEEEHWYLIIVCNPGMVLSQKRVKDFESARKEQQKLEREGANPFLMILDSLSATHSTASNKIRSYLQLEHMEKRKFPLTFGRDKMNEKYPEIPLQPNSCDCGVFLLHYVELIFEDPAKFLGADLPNLSRWFTEQEIDYKRHDMAVIIEKFAGDEVKLPKVKFPAVRPEAGQRLSRKRPRTPPYPPPPSDDGSSSPSPPPSPLKRRRRSSGLDATKSAKQLLNAFPQLLGGSGKRCSVTATRLDDVELLKRKRKRRKKKRKNGDSDGADDEEEEGVIQSRAEMLKELMKGCE